MSVGDGNKFWAIFISSTLFLMLKLAHNHSIVFLVNDNLTDFLSAVKVFNAMEKAGTNVMESTKVHTLDFIKA